MIELARLGAEVVVADLSPRQLEVNGEAAAGLEDRIVERFRADVTNLSRWDAASFDPAVCYGGPLSYVLDRAEDGVAELVRVTRPGGHVLVSFMPLVGASTSSGATARSGARRSSARDFFLRLLITGTSLHLRPSSIRSVD